MAEHPAVAEARAARARGDRIYQCSLVLSGHIGDQPKHFTLPTKADDLNVVLNQIFSVGWNLVTGAVIKHEGSTATLMTYLWRHSET